MSGPSPPTFLTQHVARALRDAAVRSRPHVTVTWAQSLDAKVAGPGGARVLLSGDESMLMTHWLRIMHDAILVGVHTVVMDDPRLQANKIDDEARKHPQILILDPHLRLPPTARMLQAWRERGDNAEGVKQPWLLCGQDADAEKAEKAEKLVAAGARVVRCELDGKGHIPPLALPGILSSLGLSSVMIEGGSRVLSTFLHAGRREDGSPLVDSVIVTVAPMFIGEGVGVVPMGEDVGLPKLRTVHTETMGKDAVMVCELE